MQSVNRSVSWFGGLFLALAAVLCAPPAVVGQSAPSYLAWDIALTPGADESQVNMAWHTSAATPTCAVQIVSGQKQGRRFSQLFYGTHFGPEVNPQRDHYNQVTLVGLQKNTEYEYRLGDGVGHWSEPHAFTTRDPHKYGFFFVSDQQIGASPDAVADTIGWRNTVQIMTDNFPEAAFMLSAGDQVELPASEAQWAGFFCPEPLTFLPIAPAIGSHDEFCDGKISSTGHVTNFRYHFNLPNESATYGVTAAGGDYYFLYGETLFVVLNMNVENSLDSEESITCAGHIAFMNRVVCAFPRVKWRIVLFHYSMYSPGYRATAPLLTGIRDAMYPAIDRLGIDVVLMGHEHVFGRTYPMRDNVVQTDQEIRHDGAVINPTGTVYFTANSSSGSKFNPLNSTLFPYIAAESQLRIPAFSYIWVEHTTLAVSTYGYTIDQTTGHYTLRETDSYNIVKHGKAD
jgi:hypothetical protein